MEANRGGPPFDPALEAEFRLWQTALAAHGHALPDGQPDAGAILPRPEQIPEPVVHRVERVDPLLVDDDPVRQRRRWPAAIFVTALILAVSTAAYRDLGIQPTPVDRLAATHHATASPAPRTPPSDRAALPAEADRGRAEQADNIAHAGEALAMSGDTEGALRFYNQSLSIRHELAARHPDDATMQRALAAGWDKVADTLAALGDVPRALAAYREAEAAWKHCADLLPGDRTVQRNWSLAVLSMGNLLLTRNEPASASEAFRRGVALQETLCRTEPDNAAWQEDLALVWLRLSDAYEQRGDDEAALRACRSALTIDEALVLRDATNLAWQGDLATAHGKAGDLLLARNDSDASLQEYRTAASCWEKLAAAESNPEYRRALAETNDRIGQALEVKKQSADALPYYQQALSAIADPATKSPGDSSLETLRAAIYLHLGRATADCQPADRQAARVALRQARDKLNGLKSDDGTPPYPEQTEMLADVERLLAELDK